LIETDELENCDVKHLKKKVAVLQKALEAQKKELPNVMFKAAMSFERNPSDRLGCFQALLSALGAEAVGRRLSTREVEAWRSYHKSLRLECRRAGIAVPAQVDREILLDNLLVNVLAKSFLDLEGVKRAALAKEQGDTPTEKDAAELARANLIQSAHFTRASGLVAIDDFPDGFPIPEV
jgi:hypothetical protein